MKNFKRSLLKVLLILDLKFFHKKMKMNPKNPHSTKAKKNLNLYRTLRVLKIANTQLRQFTNEYIRHKRHKII